MFAQITHKEDKLMKPVQVKCPICNFRVFDVCPESEPRGIISIKCKDCGKIVDIDVSEYVKKPPKSER